MKKVLAIGATVLGVVCLILAYIYWKTPASGLPTFLPGYDPTMAGIHFKHGLAAFLLAVLFFVYAWFATGKKNRAQKP
jgi:hypothetical protein